MRLPVSVRRYPAWGASSAVRPGQATWQADQTETTVWPGRPAGPRGQVVGASRSRSLVRRQLAFCRQSPSLRCGKTLPSSVYYLIRLLRRRMKMSPSFQGQSEPCLTSLVPCVTLTGAHLVGRIGVIGRPLDHGSPSSHTRCQPAATCPLRLEERESTFVNPCPGSSLFQPFIILVQFP